MGLPVRGRPALALVTVVSLVGGLLAPMAFADETTIGYSASRTSWDANESGLTPSDVAASDFGTLFTTTLPGTTATTPNQIYAQPIVADGRLIVATEENEVAGLDPATGALNWHVSLGPPWTPTSCGDLVPHIGITSTPVYDPSTSTVYVVAKSNDGPDSSHPNLRLHALDAATGTERPGWPVSIAGVGANSGLTFDPSTAHQRAGLLLLNGSVYLATASHCDQGQYVGWVAGVNTSTRSLTLWSDESGTTSAEGGIWQSGGGLMSDGDGRLFIATGNGVSPAPGPGSSPPTTLAESVVRVGVNADGSLSARDFFSPANNAKLNQNDADLGSGGPVALPDDFGTASHPHLLIQAGKDGSVYLLDRDNLGGMGQGPGGTDAALSVVKFKGVWGRAATFSDGTKHYVYLLPSTSPMEVLQVAPNGSGVPTLSVIAASSASYGYTSGSPVVTSTGTNAASALVWIATCDDSTGSNGMLRAFPAVPPAGGAWIPLVSYSLGTIAKFIQPATDGGRVYVGTRDGRVLGFGRPVTAAVSTPSTDFGLSAVGQPVTRTVTVTATVDVTVNSLGVSGPSGVFTVGTPSPALPATLAAGQTVAVPVTFTPSAVGLASGVFDVTATVSGSPGAQYGSSLTGTGTAPGLAASPGVVAFGTVGTTQAGQLGVTIQNTGSSSTTITSITLPNAPFSVTGLPATGTVLPAQQSFTASVRFSPTAAAAYSDTLTITSSDGSVSVPLTGTGVVGSGHLSIAPTTLAFGQVAPGATPTLSFTVTNTGNALLTITKAAPPAPPFSVAQPLSEGQPIAPGDSLRITVGVKPTTAEPVKAAYSISSDDGSGAHLVTMTANSSPPVGAVTSPFSCLDDRGGNHANGTPVQSSPCNGSAEQQFSMGANGSIHVGSSTSGQCLDVRSSGTANGSPVQVWTCNGTLAQQWTWRSDNSLYNPHAGKCLDIPGSSTTPGVQLQIYSCNQSGAQYWNASPLIAARGQTSSVLAPVGRLCLDDRSGGTTNGNPIQTYGCNLTPAQMLTHVGTTLRMLGQCIDVPGASRTIGTALELYRCNGTAAQVWQARSDGSLYNPNSALCLDVPKSSTMPGTRVQIYTCNGTAAQKWVLPG